MAEDTGTDKFSAWTELNASALPLITSSFCFDDKAENLDKLIEQYLDRKSLIEYMRKIQGKPVEARYWVGTKAKIDFMSASERDLRMRYRRRVTGMQIAATNRAAAAESLKMMTKSVNDVIGGDSESAKTS